MQRFLKWLGHLLFGEEPAPVQRNLKLTNSHLRAAQVRRRSALLSAANQPSAKRRVADEYDEDSELGLRIEDGGPGKNVLASPRYVREDSGTHETLRIVDPSVQAGGDRVGFDPYNTGKFDRSANWSKHVRK